MWSTVGAFRSIVGRYQQYVILLLEMRYSLEHCGIAVCDFHSYLAFHWFDNPLRISMPSSRRRCGYISVLIGPFSSFWEYIIMLTNRVNGNVSYLPLVLHAYCTSVHSSTGFSHWCMDVILHLHLFKIKWIWFSLLPCASAG